MISILTQERLLGAALGAAFMASVVFENRRAIHRSISDNSPVHYETYDCMDPPWTCSGGNLIHQPKEHMLGKKISSDFAHMWNKAVDGTLGQLVTYLSSRGW